MGDEGTVGRAFMRGAGRLPDTSIESLWLREFRSAERRHRRGFALQAERLVYADEPGGRLRELEDFSADPDEVVSIDPASVVAPGPVERYVVLPTYYGLRQLVEEGKLERTDKGYKIVKPITQFPANAAATFILPEGIELPTGQWMYPIITEQRFFD